LRVTVVIPTLTAGEKLNRCLDSLRTQTFRDWRTILVDNGGVVAASVPGVEVLSPGRNLGFSAAIEKAMDASESEYVLTLNDDTALHPDCLTRLVQRLDAEEELGSCAPKIVLSESGLLDSAGMAIARDGSSRQRGHMDPPDRHDVAAEVLFPSGCAALYRRLAIEQAGGFDPDFFLYCEDTDLGLRMQRLGWTCRYEPTAIVQHDYSQTAGPASATKIYFVERNRLAVLVKNLPLDWILLSPFYTAWRYVLHIRALSRGDGYAGQNDGGVPWTEYVAAISRAFWHWLKWLPQLWRKRRAVRQIATLSPQSFRRLLRRHSVAVSEIAGV
jgi:GT2 family glycosyltransferase